jgi:hypothetical protein
MERKWASKLLRVKVETWKAFSGGFYSDAIGKNYGFTRLSITYTTIY